MARLSDAVKDHIREKEMTRVSGPLFSSSAIRYPEETVVRIAHTFQGDSKWSKIHVDELRRVVRIVPEPICEPMQ